jgi:hypothetical protein
MPNKIYYVYCHRKKTDGKCFYIGKGTGNRYITSLSRNRYWKDIVAKHGFKTEILINNISEEKAFEFESIICNQIGYENLTNIRKETGWGGHAHQPETILKLSKSVIQYDLNGNFIKKWDSATLAAYFLNKKWGASITECCRGIRNNTYGFIWRHIDNPINEPQKIINKKEKKEKYPPYYHPIIQKDLQGNTIKIWNNAKTASKALNLKSSSIINALSGKYKTSGGYKWEKLIKKGGICAQLA